MTRCETTIPRMMTGFWDNGVLDCIGCFNIPPYFIAVTGGIVDVAISILRFFFGRVYQSRVERDAMRVLYATVEDRWRD